MRPFGRWRHIFSWLQQASGPPELIGQKVSLEEQGYEFAIEMINIKRTSADALT
jgi:hypothetical protein